MAAERPTRELWLQAGLGWHGLQVEPARLADLARAQARLEHYTRLLRERSEQSIQRLAVQRPVEPHEPCPHEACPREP